MNLTPGRTALSTLVYGTENYYGLNCKREEDQLDGPALHHIQTLAGSAPMADVSGGACKIVGEGRRKEEEVARYVHCTDRLTIGN